MNYNIKIIGQRINIGDLEGVYTKLLWNLFAVENNVTKQTGGEVVLPAPTEEAFIPAAEVTEQQKLEWLLAQYPEGWLDEQKAMLSARFAEPVVVVDDVVTPIVV